MPGPDPSAAHQAPDGTAPASSPTGGQQHHHPHSRRPEKYVQFGKTTPILTGVHLTAHSAPFHSQLEYLTHHQQQQQPAPGPGQYGQQPFDMAGLADSLPQSGQAMRPYSSPDLSQGSPSMNAYHSQQSMYPAAQRGPQPFMDPTMLARAQQQQQQMLASQYGGPPSLSGRPQGYPLHTQVPYSPVDPYGYGMGPPQFSPVDPRFAGQQQFMMPGGMLPDLSQFAHRGPVADDAPIPNFPRGPPRKPKQSGHALWVGNLPPQAVVTDLKDHFSRDATSDIESVFLIAKSNCAFVNYRTETACVAAMNRFHDSRFHGVRLVCRLRRGPSSSTSATPTETQPETPPIEHSRSPIHDNVDGEESQSPTIARSQSDPKADLTEGTTAPSDEKVPEKYFIVKSLTAQDLEASVRNGIWATQSHNETILNRAYEQADNVYLVFSANKSGQYFGYARMASAISGDPIDLSTMSATEELSPDPAGSPQSIPTPATATAPRGRIIDDSARGTIFWEANHSDDEEGSPDKEGANTPGQNWGKQFQIEWLSTNRLPFFRTRGLRNPWNANREVKIARDGTELEPGVGKRLVQMFHRPSPSPSSGPPVASPQAAMPNFR